MSEPTKNSDRINLQYEKLISIIKETFGDSERTTNLLAFYSDFEDRVKTAPASGRLNFHNAYEGGYLDHVLNVVSCAKMVKKLYEKMGGMIDFTDEELIFSAIHHDLGKLGTLKDPYYLVQESDWHRTNKLEIYKHNEDTQYMTSNDRSMFLLQEYNIKVTQNEYIAIKLTDGLYEESNKKYLQQYGAGPFPIRCNLLRIMHWADAMAASIENDVIRKELTK